MRPDPIPLKGKRQRPAPPFGVPNNAATKTTPAVEAAPKSARAAFRLNRLLVVSCEDISRRQPSSITDHPRSALAAAVEPERAPPLAGNSVPETGHVTANPVKNWRTVA